MVQIGAALQKVNAYAPVIDVMIQQQPFVVNLVWGSIRFIIQVNYCLVAFHAEIRVEVVPESVCPRLGGCSGIFN